MATKQIDLGALKILLHSARVIIKERKLYDIWDNIPKVGEPDFQANSFSQMIDQGWEPRVYQEWAEKLESAFVRNNLDLLRFETVTLSGDPRKISKHPAAIFVRQANELDRIVSDVGTLEAYKTKTGQISSWPPVDYKAGVVTQGARRHKFTDPTYVKMLELLWSRRRIESPSRELLREEERLGRSAVNETVGINDHDRFTDVATGIRKAMKSKNISLRLKYPDGVFLLVNQNGT